MNFFWIALLFPSFAVMLAARAATARILGLKGLRFFGGRVTNGEAATIGARAGVVAVSLVASYLVAAVVFFGAFVAQGRVTYLETVNVIADSPAARAGFRDGDRVVVVGLAGIDNWSQLAWAIAQRGGLETHVIVERSGERVSLTVTPAGEPGAGKIGVTPQQMRAPADLLASLKASIAEPISVDVATAAGYEAVVTRTSQAQLIGPVGLVSQASRAAETGLANVLFLIGTVLAWLWPVTAIGAIALVPRVAKKPA